MGSRKVNTEGIDEELLLASIGRRTQDGTLRPAQEVPATAPTEDDTAACCLVERSIEVFIGK